MDTRDKIIALERAVQIIAELRGKGIKPKVVTGYFDVLLAAHVRRLREVRNGTDRLLVMVLDPPEPVLQSRARAELVAALGMVDYVVPVEKHKAEELLRHFDAGEIVREETADLTRARALAEHVHGRQHT